MRALPLKDPLNQLLLLFRACPRGVRKKLLREKNEKESSVVTVVGRYVTYMIYKTVLCMQILASSLFLCRLFGQRD